MPPEKQLLYGRNFSVKCLVVGVRHILPDPLSDPSFTRKASHILLHPGGTGFLHRFGDVPVDIQGKSRCRVAEVALHGFDIISVLQRQNRIGMSKIMDPRVRRADFNSKLLEMIISGLRLQWGTEDCGECQRCPVLRFRMPSDPGKGGFFLLLDLLLIAFFHQLHHIRCRFQDTSLAVFQ